MTNPVVFISYSHDSPEHERWALSLATDLRSKGVEIIIDQWDLEPGQDVVAFMHQGIAQSERVLLICTSDYVEKAEHGTGGVGYEKMVVTHELVQNIDTKKFIPLVRGNPSTNKTPNFLGPRLYIDFSNDAEYDSKLDDLLRAIFGQPKSAKPALGPIPFSGSMVKTSDARGAGPTGVTRSGVRVLDEPWFEQQSIKALAALQNLGLRGHMEVRLALHDVVAKSQIELLSAAGQSEIRTFGWPIGLVMTKEEYRPRPFEDGIRAEVAIDKRGLSGEPSYDYWALRSNGDYYLSQSFFEDQRASNRLFFNTRIVRIAEVLMFAGNLYRHLGAPSESRLSLRITHRGLEGRQLDSSNPARYINGRTTQANQSQSEIVVDLATLRNTLVNDVQRIAAPLFMLFDFQEFGAPVYVDIVRRFEKGEVT